MTREEFREAVLSRDGGKCVICESDADDAHHIMDRSLFDDGGNDVNNGASLCSMHHLMAERTIIPCWVIRLRAGITRLVLPSHLGDDQMYDKWGNIIIENGKRLKGDLFHEPSVQKALKEGDALRLFLPYIKYPRTFHLPWSNPSSDDRVMEDLSGFIGEEIVVSVKMDGENTNLYRDRIHARSIEPAMGLDRSMVKAIQGRIASDIPEGWRVCGENLYAKHSIHYHHLKAWFYVFGIWDETNRCLSWDDTIEWCELLDLMPVPVIYRGPWDEDLLRNLPSAEHDGDEMEGFVVRVARSFPHGEFHRAVAKYVRADHVTSDRHWRYQEIVPNEIG